MTGKFGFSFISAKDVITKTIGEGLYSGYLYVHEKHLGKTVKIVVLHRKITQEAD